MKSSNKRVGDYGERKIISDVFGPLLGEEIGDDCAISGVGKKVFVSTTDKVPEKLIAEDLGLMDFYSKGYYLAVSNLSDVASMGARPLGFLASFSVPGDFRVEDLEDLARGCRDACIKHDTKFVGGDTSSSSVASFVGSAFGIVDKERVLRRNGQHPGDYLFTTGHVGLFSTALFYFLKAKPAGMNLEEDLENVLLSKLIRPKARFLEGRLLGESKACTSCMDISDGLLMSLRDLSYANNLGSVVKEKDLPIHEASLAVASYLGIDVLDIVFGAGADYELLGSVKADKVGYVRDLFEKNGAEIYFFGNVIPAKDVMVYGKDKNLRKVDASEWEHFLYKDAKDVVFRRFKNE